MANDPRSHHIIGLSLIGIDIRTMLQDDEKDVDAEFNYQAEIEPPELLDSSLMVFASHFGLQKTYKDVADVAAEVKVRYYCGVAFENPSDSNLEQADLEQIAKGFAATTGWASFVSLGAIVTQQMGISFPLLPAMPIDVQLKKGEGGQSR